MRVVAPGKLVLVGEYAVVDGAPAVVCAVDRGVQLDWRPGGDLHVATPTGDDRFVRAALEDVGAPGGTWSFTDWNPPASTTKVGLGGSASAVVAAVLGGLAARGRPPTPDELQVRAARVHHAVQGSGSGIDVAAAAHGGVLQFEGGAVRALSAALVQSERLVVVFTGASAATGPRVERYRAFADRAAFALDSRRVVEGFAADPVGALEANAALLADLDRRAGLGWSTPTIELLRSSARAAGGAAKPSGAGGGDVVVGLFPDAARATAWSEELAARGLLLVPVRLAPGAWVEPVSAGFHPR